MLPGADKAAMKVTASRYKLSWRMKLKPPGYTQIQVAIDSMAPPQHPHGRRNSRVYHQQEKPWLQSSGMRKELFSCKLLVYWNDSELHLTAVVKC
jgi:hypothetical protein